MEGHVLLGKLDSAMGRPQTVVSPEKQIRQVFSLLSRTWGPQHWWPAQSRFEVIVGAFLTHNTSWANVERAIRQLEAARALTIPRIRDISLPELETLIRSSGYFRQKARRLKLFVRFLDDAYGGSLTRMFAQPTEKLRAQLLSLNGVGPETADSILLYAGQHPVFVVDAYTRRLAARHQIASEKAPVEELRALFERALADLAPPLRRGALLPDGASHPPSRMSTAPRTPAAQAFNLMHGFIVGIGKNYCHKSHPDCEACPLRSLLPPASIFRQPQTRVIRETIMPE